MNRFLRASCLFTAGLLATVHGASLPLLALPWPVSPLPQPLHMAQSPQSAQLPGVEVRRLQDQLNAQNWQAADAETRRLLQPWIHPNGDIFAPPLPGNIPPEVVQTIDRLWAEASGGRFGFRAQSLIWEQVRAQQPADANAATTTFGDRVGWTRSTPAQENGIALQWLTEPELHYSLQAPVGHLPWAGVSWERITALLNQQSCGSCTVDAMYLQGERFQRYVPVLLNGLTTALNHSLPPAGSWSRARLTHTIDLRTLYSSSNCPVYSHAQAISPNGALVAIGSYSYERACGGGPNNSTLALWNAQRGNRLITLLRGQAMEAFSDPGQPQEPPTEGTRLVGDVVNAIAFTPDSQYVAAGLSNGTVRLWRVDRGELVRTLSGHRYAVRAIAINSDGQQLASASADGTIKLWTLATGQLQRTIRLNPSHGIVYTLRLSPNGQRLAIATNRNTLQLWDTRTGQEIRTLATGTNEVAFPLPIAFSPDGQRLATGDRDRSIKLWNPTTGARLITLRNHSAPVQHLSFSPHSQQLASSDEKTAHLWNLQTYQPIRSFELMQSAGHPVLPNNLAHVAFSPDGRVLAAHTLLLPAVESEPIPRQGITLWEIASGQPLTQIRDVNVFQFSPNGQFLMAQGQQVQLWYPSPPPSL